jgi:hypothetical protein
MRYPSPHPRLPALDSITYRTIVWRERTRRERAAQRGMALHIGLLAAALAFIHDATILRAMQLELD